MRKINLGQTVTILANVGVIIGIVFLAVEIQQNTRTLQAAAVQESINVARQQILLYASDADTNRIDMLGAEDLSQLSPEEQQRFFWLNRSGMLGLQGLFRQWELGILPDDDWDVWARITCWNTRTSGFQELWPGNVEILNPRFVEFAESCSEFRNSVPDGR